MNYMFISLGCLAVLTMFATACDRGELDSNPDDVWIESIQVFGVGCPDPGSALIDLAPDKQSLTLVLKDLRLHNPDGPPIQTTNCVASVKLHVPAGRMASFSKIDTRGYVFLDEGLRARLTTSYFIAGDPNGDTAHQEFEGPYDDLYSFTDTIPPQSVVWTGCGVSSIFAADVSLVLNAVDNPTGLGIFNDTTGDRRFRMALDLQTKKC